MLDPFLFVEVLFKKNDERAVLPSYAKPGDAGMDLHCLESFSLAPSERRLIKTGLLIAIKPGFEGQVRSRSGTALNRGVVVLNSPGTIDSGYRGEANVILMNLGGQTQSFAAGDRIAQLVISPVVDARVWEVPEGQDLPPSVRGANGFGSTGA